jgi:hypothetical protein
MHTPAFLSDLDDPQVGETSEHTLDVAAEYPLPLLQKSDPIERPRINATGSTVANRGG